MERKETKNTLYRFLSSKGLRKDKNGIDALSPEEIQAIENGIPNVDLMGKSGLFQRIHQTCWKLETIALVFRSEEALLRCVFNFGKLPFKLLVIIHGSVLERVRLRTHLKKHMTTMILA